MSLYTKRDGNARIGMPSSLSFCTPPTHDCDSLEYETGTHICHLRLPQSSILNPHFGRTIAPKIGDHTDSEPIEEVRRAFLHQLHSRCRPAYRMSRSLRPCFSPSPAVSLEKLSPHSDIAPSALSPQQPHPRRSLPQRHVTRSTGCSPPTTTISIFRIDWLCAGHNTCERDSEQQLIVIPS